MTGPRAERRATLEAAILAVGKEHLARDGAAGLSLRAVARDLGLASSAVYRYVESRDELLTRLIVDAYTSLGDAVDAQLAADANPLAGFRIVGRTVREWGLEHPELYALLYGSPVPGYHAPSERTTTAGTRVVMRLVEGLAGLQQNSLVAPASPAEDDRAGRALAPLLADAALAGSGLSPAVFARGLAAWAMILGAISAELFHQYGPQAFGDPALHFETVLDLAEDVVRGSD